MLVINKKENKIIEGDKVFSLYQIIKQFLQTLLIDINEYLLGDPEVTANIYGKSRNLPNTDTQNYSTDFR